MATTKNYPQGPDSFQDVVDDVDVAKAEHVNDPHDQLELVQTDLTQSRTRSQFTADGGEADITQYKICYVHSNDTVRVANAGAIATMPVKAIAADAAITAGNSGYMVTKGEVTNGGWAWTAGADLYAAKVDGNITDDISAYVAGNVVQKIGHAITATKIMFDPSPEVIVL